MCTSSTEITAAIAGRHAAFIDLDIFNSIRVEHEKKPAMGGIIYGCFISRISF